MISKLALKRLTASDLTFFEWQFRNRNAGNQKAINLNADVLTGQLYPALDTIARERHNKLGVDLWIAGPDAAESVNLQRKIIKGTAYKNWRLDGEFVYNPEGAAERFNVLQPGDIALLGFVGELAPDTVTLLLVGKNTPQDQSLFQGLDEILGTQRMIALESETLGHLCHLQGVPQSHPVWSVVSDEDLAEAAAGQAPAVGRILTRPRSANLSLIELQEARREAERIGRLGEELFDIHLRRLLESGEIAGYDWTSDVNAISPYDFRVETIGSTEKQEIKTTKGDFGREFYLSLAELRDMALGEEPYIIGRVYQVTPEGAKLRYSHQLRAYGQSILDALSTLPDGVTANGVTIRPDETMFDEEINLAGPVDPEE
jgi:hypothetical protein